MTTYRVAVWREPDGSWSASADGLDGAFTAGDSLSEVDTNIRESIAVTLDLPRSAQDAMDVALYVRVDEETDRLVAETIEARNAAARAPELTAGAVHALRARGLSIRDVARVVGITPGRVAQIDKARAA